MHAFGVYGTTRVTGAGCTAGYGWDIGAATWPQTSGEEQQR